MTTALITRKYKLKMIYHSPPRVCVYSFNNFCVREVLWFENGILRFAKVGVEKEGL